MKVFMTGGTGFVGKNLTRALIREGQAVTILTRSKKPKETFPAGASLVVGNPLQKGDWQSAVKEHDVVINLAGASTFSRWSEEMKNTLRASRLLTTRNLVEALEGGRIQVFFSTSAVGYYGFHGDEILTEESPPGTDFLAQLAEDWEKEAWKAEGKCPRVVITRFGTVLGEKEGALSQMTPLFNKYLGGPLGSGKQWFPWIHIDDLTRAFLFLMDYSEISGPVNFTSPNSVRNKTMAQALGKALNRPSFLPAPGFLLKLFLGEFGSVLLKGQRVIPVKLLKSGFQFSFPEIDMALEQILHLSPS